MTVEQRGVLEALNRIIDPCSAVAGVPAGLVDMGMVHSVSIEDAVSGAHVRVELLMTEFGCLMSVPFQVTATDAIGDLPGVSRVDVAITTVDEWTEDRMTPQLREALAERRTSRRRQLGMPSVRSDEVAAR